MGRAEPQHGGIRAIWVTRWDFKTPQDVARIMANCRAAGFTDVLVQVRGNGTALYRSSYEPWAEEFAFQDPGFDPLAVAVRQGRRNGLRVHAWVNVMPGWRGEAPPADRRQLYHRRPEWFLRDAAGRRQPLGWYVSLNPCLPEVRRYLATVMTDIVRRYDVDGLHLDYVRLPIERTNAYKNWRDVPDYPRDGRTLALFRRETGQSPDTAPDLWNDWRVEQVTRLVVEIRAATRKANPRVVLSVAAGADPAEHRRKYFQDVKAWIGRGLVDAVLIMNYSENETVFSERLAQWANRKARVPLVVGIMFDRRDPLTVDRQLRQARAATGHVAAFAYHSLFERQEKNGRIMFDGQSTDRERLRKQIIPQLQQPGGAVRSPHTVRVANDRR